MHRLSGTPLLAVLAAALAVGAGGGAAIYAALTTHDTRTVVRQVTVGSASPAASTDPLSVGDVYKRAYKGVVKITVTTSSTQPFGGSDSQTAQGSGFVYDTAGHIITNDHVVGSASSISVRFWDGSTAKATLVGTDASTDLAVIKVDPGNRTLVPLSLGNSDKVSVGDGVVAIGSPFGLDETLTSGIVSALHRQMTSPNDFTISDSIQTDAAINHGNSGGPLLDLEGKVIGVNSQIESDSGGNDGVGFAVPSNTVKSVVSQLLSGGKVQHAFLGVSAVTIPTAVAGQLGVPAGAEVATVRGGTPAAKSGFRAASGTRSINGESYPTGGDVITAVDGRHIGSVPQLIAAVNAKRPGDTVSITYVRGGKRHTIRVTLANRPS